MRIASALFEIEASEPRRRPRQVLWCVCVLLGTLLIWACFAKLDIVTVAQGNLVPQSYVKIVQPAEAGVIREILVNEGDFVDRNQVLIRLDRTINSTDTDAVVRELSLNQLELRRIESELSGEPLESEPGDDEQLFAQVEARYLSHREAFLDSIAQGAAARLRAQKEIDAAKELLKKLEETLPSYIRSAEAYEKLAEKNLVGALQAEERRREALERKQDLEAQRATVAALRATLSQHDRQLEQLKSTYASDLTESRLQVVAVINRLQQELSRLRYQSGLLELRAPEAGVVNELATTTVGSVVQPGAVLLNLVPQDEPLLAEVVIQNRDVGFVEPGQAVRIKVVAFPFQKYGMLDGVVNHVSATSSAAGNAGDPDKTSMEGDGGLIFSALVALEDQRLQTRGMELPVSAGMQVTAEIMQGKRTVLEYLLSPIQRVASEAGMER